MNHKLNSTVFVVWLTNERHLALFLADTISNLRHVASRIWNCAEPEFGLCWMKLCSSDNHCTTGCFHSFDTTMWYVYCKSFKEFIWVIFISCYFPIGLGRKATLFSPLKIKNCLKNYYEISLLPIFNKTSEWLIFNDFFNFFLKSVVYRLSIKFYSREFLYFATTIYNPRNSQKFKKFDWNPPEDVRGVFPDIFKAVNKVWHEGLIFKLKTFDVEGKLIMLLENYFKKRKQMVALNGLTS